MIDHIGFAVSDLSASRGFYERALSPLGISVIMEVTEEMTGGHGAHLGFGRDINPFFWVGTGDAASAGVHVAFAAPDRATVDAFYQAALDAGGTDNGAPGLRPEYHPNYYGAFVRDPDGNNIEAVFHGAAS
ncbi:VOC family protein [Paracoccus tegillarcae]|uniref:Glyoxalase/bleomycin resistance/extradiol dioxygenase family protein n=1 Tax=Paracoccus tegillarcae TaxID=1529068 RepID=A0A2K9EPW0_9RHOB|nr:VOC family protein [Paracoccus tegillarcae]AUH33685.1 glyoxalase/bleomycin resistance/extradiol dioxygenase family protein [Paracoccus tegillarcae]